MTESEILSFLKNIDSIDIKPHEEPKHEEIPDITEFSGFIILKNDQKDNLLSKLYALTEFIPDNIFFVLFVLGCFACILYIFD